MRSVFIIIIIILILIIIWNISFAERAVDYGYVKDRSTDKVVPYENPKFANEIIQQRQLRDPPSSDHLVKYSQSR